MSYYVFVDNSNVWIEGKYVSAVHKGFAKDINVAHQEKIQDNGWAIDFGMLLYQVTDTNIHDVREAILFGSRPTDNDSLWESMRKNGFEVNSKSRNASNKEKQIDTGIVAEMMKTLYTVAHAGDTFILVMGDGDYVPVMQNMKERDVTTVLAFWDHASGELKKAADSFINLSKIIDKITYCP